MRSCAAFLAIEVVCTFLLLGKTALAKSDHYVVDAFGDASGYAELEVSPAGLVSGQICAFEPLMFDPPRERSILGKVKVTGKQTRNALELRFAVDDVQGTPAFKKVLPRGTVKLVPQTVLYDGLLQRSKGWTTNDPVTDETKKGRLHIDLSKIPDSLSTPRGDRYADIIIKAKTIKFDLAKFDRMTPNQALSLIPTIDWDDIISPSIVTVVYKPDNRDLIAKLLSNQSTLAFLVDPPLPDCGSPFIEDEIQVPPLLEFYFARQIQLSGLVVRAYPEVLPKTPPFTNLPLRTATIAATFRDNALSLDEKYLAFASFFESQLEAFVKARRLTFDQPVEIVKRSSGFPLGYHAQVTGPSISLCQKTGWEQFEIQILPAPGVPLEIYLQVLNGFEAPGSLSERPADTRFRDNTLNEERLQKIQDFLADFLVLSGVTTANDSKKGSTRQIACRL